MLYVWYWNLKGSIKIEKNLYDGDRKEIDKWHLRIKTLNRIKICHSQSFSNDLLKLSCKKSMHLWAGTHFILLAIGHTSQAIKPLMVYVYLDIKRKKTLCMLFLSPLLVNIDCWVSAVCATSKLRFSINIIKRHDLWIEILNENRQFMHFSSIHYHDAN